MPPRITDGQRKAVLALLAQGFACEAVAAQVGVTPGQVSAVTAHLKMGTYETHGAHATLVQSTLNAGRERVHDLLEEIGVAGRRVQTASGLNRILSGVDVETDEEVFWNPDPTNGAVNPHMLILGESGFGKTYTICCLLTELAQSQIPSIVFDYGQGFTTGASPRHFAEVDLTTSALAELYHTLSRMGREASQGEIGVVIDSKYYGITEYSEE